MKEFAEAVFLFGVLPILLGGTLALARLTTQWLLKQLNLNQRKEPRP